MAATGGRSLVFCRQMYSFFSGTAKNQLLKLMTDSRPGGCRNLTDVLLDFQRALHTTSRPVQCVKSSQYCTTQGIVPESQSSLKRDVRLINTVPKTQNETDILQCVNTTNSMDMGRLFAVVHVRGNQRKVTTEDVIIINGDFPPNIGDRIRLEKVLMVGGKDFSLIGSPLLSRDVVKVEATVIEKTFSHFRIQCLYLRRHNRYRKIKAKRSPQTMLLINSIEIISNDMGTT